MGQTDGDIACQCMQYSVVPLSSGMGCRDLIISGVCAGNGCFLNSAESAHSESRIRMEEVSAGTIVSGAHGSSDNYSTLREVCNKFDGFSKAEQLDGLRVHLPTRCADCGKRLTCAKV
jgi:hypothetical protein